MKNRYLLFSSLYKMRYNYKLRIKICIAHGYYVCCIHIHYYTYLCYCAIHFILCDKQI
jgi:hypothetical protein